jgi:type I restriction enzyme M protein
LEDIKKHGYVLSPGRFVGAEDELDDGVPFEEKFKDLKDSLEQQFNEGRRLEGLIETTLSRASET